MGKRIRKGLLFGIIFVLFTATFVITVPMNVNAVPRTWFVDDVLGGFPAEDFTSIQAAINDPRVNPLDKIYVYKGTYTERVTINKTLTLEGENRDQTVIDGSSGGTVVTITADNVTMTKFNITDPGTGHGLHLYGNASNKVKDCVISNIKINNEWRALALVYANSNTIENNICNSNSEDGIISQNSDFNIFSKNTCNSNGLNGIYFNDCDNNIINNNNCSNNGYNGINMPSYSGAYCEKNIVANNTCNYNTFGISMDGNSNIIINNTCLHNKVGIRLHYSKNTYVFNNTMVSCGISIIGLTKEYWNTHTIPTNNTVNSKPVYYWKNQTSGTIPSGAGEVILANCTNVRINGQNVSDGTDGIILAYTSHSLIDNNTSNSNKEHGIFLYMDNYNNTLFNNTLNSNNDYGSYLYRDNDYNMIRNSDINNNDFGVYIKNSDSNVFENNNIESNTNYGIKIIDSNNNLIFHNNFISNNNGSPQAYDNNDNDWDNGYPLGGNYWDDLDEESEGAFDDFRGTLQDTTYNDNYNTDIGDGIVDNGSGSSGVNTYFIDGKESPDEEHDTYPLIFPVVNDLVQRPPIRIESDSDFDDEHGVISGNGSKDNPYIISGWDINGDNYGYCLFIGDTSGETSKHFKIRNCYIHNASGIDEIYYWDSGIILHRVQNGYQNQYYNEITSYDWNIGDPYSISKGYIITKQTIVKYNNKYGIYLHGMEDIPYIFTENIRIDDCIIKDNNLDASGENDQGGIGVLQSRYCLIINNSISSNYFGIHFITQGTYITIKENLIKDNSNYGIRIEEALCSLNNSIYHNNLYYNNGATTTYDVDNVQAYDKGGLFSNQWDNGYSTPFNPSTDGGNYWCDWTSPDVQSGPNQDQEEPDGIVDDPYIIDPQPSGHWYPGFKDRYPLINLR